MPDPDADLANSQGIVDTIVDTYAFIRVWYGHIPFTLDEFVRDFDRYKYALAVKIPDGVPINADTCRQTLAFFVENGDLLQEADDAYSVPLEIKLRWPKGWISPYYWQRCG